MVLTLNLTEHRTKEIAAEFRPRLGTDLSAPKSNIIRQPPNRERRLNLGPFRGRVDRRLRALSPLANYEFH